MHRSARLVAAVVSIVSAAVAQVPLPTTTGYRANEQLAETANPFGFAGFAPGRAPGDLFYAVDHAVYHVDAAGVVELIHAYPFRAHCDLLVREAGNALYYADDLSGTLTVRDVASGAERTRPLPPNTFDLVTIPPGHVLVAANPAWPSAAARPGIWLLDPTGGNAHCELVRFGAGASGPLAIEPATGDLIYAQQTASYPPPPRSIHLLRYRAATIAAAIAACGSGGPPLTEADAIRSATGLDGAFDLAFDDRGALLVSNPQDGRVEVVRPDGTLRAQPLVGPTPGRSALGLAFADGGPATFDPFQPDAGATLLVGTNDWVTRAAVHAVRAARPLASSPNGPTVPAGRLAIELDGLPPQSTAFVLFNILPLLPNEQELLRVGGVPVWWSVDLLMPPLSGTVTADRSGHARLDLPYAGGLSWTVAFQAAALTSPPAAALLVTSTPVSVTLLP